MKFIHISDPHIMLSYQSLFLGFMEKLYSPIDKLSVIFQEINWSDVDFLALTGDLIHDGGLEDYKLLKKILQTYLPKDLPIIYVMGNHDNRKAFLEVFSEDLLGPLLTSESIHYTVKINGVELIILDSTSPGQHGGYISEDQLTSLNNLLLSGDKESKQLLFLHHPIWWPEERVRIKNRDQVLEILQGSGIEGIFVGHTHRNRVSSHNGLDQYCADSSSFIMDCKKEGYFRVIDKVGYSVVEVTERGISNHYEQLFAPNVVGEISIQAMKERIEKGDNKNEEKN